MSLPLVYISGPYSEPDPVENTHTTIQIGTRLYETGLVVPLIPHLTLLWHVVVPRPREFWYSYDLAVLRHCDALFLIPGMSAGAEQEVALCHELGFPVFRDEQELLAWARSFPATEHSP